MADREVNEDVTSTVFELFIEEITHRELPAESVIDIDPVKNTANKQSTNAFSPEQVRPLPAASNYSKCHTQKKCRKIERVHRYS